jgi:hypothetical protein
MEKKWEYNGRVHQLFMDFKKAYDSVWREVLYNILIQLGSFHPMALQPELEPFPPVRLA